RREGVASAARASDTSMQLLAKTFARLSRRSARRPSLRMAQGVTVWRGQPCEAPWVVRTQAEPLFAREPCNREGSRCALGELSRFILRNPNSQPLQYLSNQLCHLGRSITSAQ